ncbi:SDR family NAD(P)-dependent oxidoreductase [Tsukamurella sp. 8F]|uniref:SDR family NAD(P)-dependent oxidoreductase n=1 Tax=unclassified Tsukamurella TaxID=2633480 RepID=UPI0023B88F54|nr:MULTISPECIES: SDR family NAD(P)-dependent oxidoreductase [unclassified Tsukamurella]MDF0530104.1 SDR family NAD(P)-dependent oxidoreductase [Tsukamurella sp. 8J]MDF0586422.1 SDR family NAD(P)-dependent oxidoreductase [Tsukamurella sp. 8F]
MSAFAGKVAVVTGAGSGIGAALAAGLAERGARLALSDVDAEGLGRTVASLGGTDAHTRVLDVTDRDAVERYAADVAEHYGVVHQVYNNAGIAPVAGSVLTTSYEDYERVIGVNLWGVLHGTKAFLPHLIASGDGHLVNVSSLNGYMAQAGLSAYCTTKFGVRGFTESVRSDMLAAGLPVAVTVVHPGGVKTNIATSGLAARGDDAGAAERAAVDAYNAKLLKMAPTDAVRIILDGVAKKKARVLVGNDARSVDVLVRLLPSLYPRLVNRMMARVMGDSAMELARRH